MTEIYIIKEITNYIEQLEKLEGSVLFAGCLSEGFNIIC